ncbi:MAG: Fur family transcriptional regulator [Actinomycetota bacterium]
MSADRLARMGEGVRPRSDAHATAQALLARNGYRYTRNRRALVEVLAGADRPLTIRDILRSRRRLVQSSVYQALDALEKVGVVHRVVTADDSGRYELTESLTNHHHHLVCTNCGKVEDFSAPSHLERRVTDAIEEIAAGRDFTPEGHRLDLVGLCADCS